MVRDHAAGSGRLRAVFARIDESVASSVSGGEASGGAGEIMNLRQMEVFHAIMTTGSVTGAARLLNVTQPTVSTVLRHCEDQLRFRLFNRIGGRLQPTPEAEAIYPEIASIFQKVDLVSGQIQEAARGRTESISVVGTFAVANGPLAAAAATFLSKHPKVHISIQALPRLQVIDWIARHQADLGSPSPRSTIPGCRWSA